MARSFSNAKFISTFMADRFSVIASRRGYAAAAAESSSNVMLKKGGEEESKVTMTMASWVPDPVTGYYRPEGIKQIDVAELRRMLLNNKN